MKMLLIVNDLSGTNGWSTYAINIINQALGDGHGVDVAVNTKYPFPLSNVTQYSVLQPPHTILWHPLRILKGWIMMRNLIAVTQPDIIHVIAEPYIQLFGIRNSSSIPIILTLHGTYATLPRTAPKGIRQIISTFFFLRALKRVKRIISVSAATKNTFLKYVSAYDATKITIIPNSIQLPDGTFHLAKNRNRSEYAIITVGAVKRRKGIHNTIELFSRWAELRKIRVKYEVVGYLEESSHYVKQVKEMAEEKSSEYFKTVFYGHVDDSRKNELLRTADLYAHLERVDENGTDVEGFGIGILEAASFGIPAIVASGSATTEAVKNAVSGQIIDLNKKDEAYTVIDNLLVGKGISPAKTVEWALEHSPSTIYKQIVRVYGESSDI